MAKERTKKLELLKTVIGTVTARREDGTLQVFQVLYGGGMLPWVDGKMKYVKLSKYKEILRTFLTETEEGQEYIAPTDMQVVADRAFVINNDKKGLYSISTPEQKKSEEEKPEEQTDEAPSEETKKEDVKEPQQDENSQTQEEQPTSNEDLNKEEPEKDVEETPVEEPKQEEAPKEEVEEPLNDETPIDLPNPDVFNSLQEAAEEPREETSDRLEETFKESENLTNEIIEKLKQEKEELENKLAEAQSELELVTGTLNSSKEDLDKALENKELNSKELNDTKSELGNVKKQLEEAKKEIEDSKNLLADKDKELSETKTALDEHKTKLDASTLEIDNAKKEIESLKLQGSDKRSQEEIERTNKLVSAIKNQNTAIIELRDKMLALEKSTKEVANRKLVATSEIDPKQLAPINKKVEKTKMFVLISIIVSLIACALIPLCSIMNLRDTLNLNNHDEVELHAVINGDNGETDYVLIGTFSVEDGVITFEK